MTPEKVERAVKRIASVHKTNAPAAALMEVGLYRRVLEAIADDDAQSPKNCARLALRARDLGMNVPPREPAEEKSEDLS